MMTGSTRAVATLGLCASLGLSLAAQGAATSRLGLAALPGWLGWKYATLQFRAREAFPLGILVPATGPDAETGKEIKEGTTLAFEAVDWHIGKFTIIPVWIDSRSDPAQAAQAYEKAISNDHIQAGLGGWDSEVALAVMDITGKHQIPHLLGLASSGRINEKFKSRQDLYGYWMLKSRPSPERSSAAFVQALQDAARSGTFKPKRKTVCICSADSDYGRAAGKGFAAALTQAGWTVLGQETFPSGQLEFQPMLGRVKALDPEVVCASGAQPGLTALAGQADAAGVRGLLIADGQGQCGAWYQLTGNAADLLPDPAPVWGSAQGKAFAATYQAAYGRQPNPATAGVSYDNTRFFIQMANELVSEGFDLTGGNIYRFVKDNVWTGKWWSEGGVVSRKYRFAPGTLPDPVVEPGGYAFPPFRYYGGAGKLLVPGIQP
jgi:branched-chain amino acid transport system substrate-binding protein